VTVSGPENRAGRTQHWRPKWRPEGHPPDRRRCGGTSRSSGAHIPKYPHRVAFRAIQSQAFGLQKGCSARFGRRVKREKSLQITGGRTWIRTRDLFLIRKAPLRGAKTRGASRPARCSKRCRHAAESTLGPGQGEVHDCRSSAMLENRCRRRMMARVSVPQ